MNKLNRFFVIFCATVSFTLHAQTTSNSWFHQVEDDVQKPLPKVLLSFDAIFTDKKVELTWASDTENNNNFFTVEKSKDAVVFEEVLNIKGFGNYSSLISYFDMDFNPYEGVSYYRLSQTDEVGNVLSSRLVSVNNTSASTNLASNNLLDEPSGNLMGSENKEVIVVLRNEKGLESFSKVIVDQNNNVIVPADSDYKLDNGTYTVIASSNNRLYSQKVFVK